MQRYFKGMTIVGWVHCQPGFGAVLMAKDEAYHKENFREKWQVLFVLDTMDKLDSFYIYQEEGTGLRQAKGYFVYYDKNREMQEYMLENSLIRARDGAGEPMRDIKEEEEEKVHRSRKSQAERLDAAQDIRRVLQKRERVVKQAKREHDRLLAAVCCVLCVVCLSLGIAMFRSLDRLQMVEDELVAMQTTYQTLAEDFEGVKVQRVFAVQEEEPAQEMAENNEERTVKYIVEGGDSLGYISRKFYGDNEGIERIMAANGLENADMIYEGQALWIPAE
jgi:nucleoid-associated protein YgaU